MSKFSFRLYSEFLDEFPAYVDFILALSSDPKTYRYGTFLRLNLVLAWHDLPERQCDEAICEVLGYTLPSPGEPLPVAYRAVKSRAKAYRDWWLASRSATKQTQGRHATVGGSYGKAA